MNYHKAHRFAAGAVALASLALCTLQASAQINVNTDASVSIKATTSVRAKLSQDNSDERMSQFKLKADQEIDRRMTALTNLSSLISGMKHVSAADKASLSAYVQGQIKLMTDLKAKINADTTLDLVKADVKSITSSYRVFVLVIPKGHIEVAADRALDIAALAGDLSLKLGARIDASQAAGNDISTLKALLSNMNSTSADAKIQAQAALDLVANLTPDGGDQAKMESNKQALQASRANIKAASKDLEEIRKDVRMIIVGLKLFNLKASGKISASSTVSATALPGEHCGGNIRNALQCGAGYHCAGSANSSLPMGDVGGTCVANQ